MDKQPDAPLVLEWQVSGQFSTLSFSMSSWTPDLEMTLSDENGRLENLPVEEGADIPYHFDITGSEKVTITIAEMEDSEPIGTTLTISNYSLA